MKSRYGTRTGPVAGSLALAAAILWSLAGAAKEAPSQIDGLVRVKDSKLDYVYVLPNATLAGYKRVRIDPVDVAFDKNWKPNEHERSPSRQISDSDIEKIRSTVASEFRKVFIEELKEGGYNVVDTDGPDVLRVTPFIVNLYITAPDKMTAGRSRSYVASSGHMSLIAVLRDSVTGQNLVKAVDNVQGRQTNNFQIANSVTNLGDARFAFGKWARVLREALDRAKVDTAGNTKVAEE